MAKIILWDFDGVILDSMSVRDWGFEEIFKEYPKDLVEKLIDYHRENGGLSRYVKIRFFFEELLKQSITVEEVFTYAEKFSDLMKKKLINPKNLIFDSISFIKENYERYQFHIVSGSDQEELRFLSEQLGIAQYFISIHGSPTSKTKLVAELISKHNYNITDICLIGDSVNDYKAADDNNIFFFNFNNDKIKDLGMQITNFSNFNF